MTVPPTFWRRVETCTRQISRRLSNTRLPSHLIASGSLEIAQGQGFSIYILERRNEHGGMQEEHKRPANQFSTPARWSTFVLESLIAVSECLGEAPAKQDCCRLSKGSCCYPSESMLLTCNVLAVLEVTETFSATNRGPGHVSHSREGSSCLFLSMQPWKLKNTH